EEKRQVIEYQLKEELYNWREDVRPNVVGKFDGTDGDATGGEWSMPNPGQNWLLRAKADLNPAIIAKAIAKRLKKLGVDADTAARIDARIALIDAKERSLEPTASVQATDRTPWFCSGCPHNTSTRVPEGSRAMAGIGCHYMVTWMDRSTSTFTQMGGEGVPWLGQAPFTTDRHVFANLGDATYFHSGLLAIRQSIAAGVNITYKILFNDAVAMTGGQPVDGTLRVPAMTRELEAEGVKKLVVVTDEPEKYTSDLRLAPGVTVHHRDDLDAIQKELREIEGCTVLIYDQTCATEKRRRRKRGTLAEPDKRVVINELVCEGCGDCSVQSNCLSVEPVETEFGRKRRINQNSCNKDYSCVKGFCPSFVTVEGGQLKSAKKAPASRPDPFKLPPIAQPVLPLSKTAWGIVVAGVGGTGVITIGSLLGMAAHLEGKGVITQDAAGLAQKGGSTWSHIQIADHADAIFTTKVGTAEADLVIACDPIVAATKTTLSVMREGRTFVALNSHGSPTAAFVTDPNWQFPGASCEAAVAAAAGMENVGAFDVDALATALLGDSIYANPMLLGYAFQRGKVPLSHQSLLRAIELNGVQVENNKAAFEWGRRAASDLVAVKALAGTAGGKGAQVIEFVRKPTLDDMISKRVEFLTGYQNAAYATRYSEFVAKVREAESRLGTTRLTETVARYLFKLMAYKDEYEVARLHTDRSFADKIAAQFEGNYKLNYHLAPPLLARRNSEGHLVKKQFGPWVLTVFRVLAKFKGLRGTLLDPFGKTAERRMERMLIREYIECIDELLPELTADRLSLAVEIARIPEDIRGYGHVKEKHTKAAQKKWSALLLQWSELDLAAA
ncbi:MAG: indolepyruvate ferredoxin oxidoreductase family protein, partial [Rhizobacter sp.]|nr:indolepyruvate ferredoxin oxidoreductase family protein [Rhizobacter sp.]